VPLFLLGIAGGCGEGDCGLRSAAGGTTGGIWVTGCEVNWLIVGDGACEYVVVCGAYWGTNVRLKGGGEGENRGAGGITTLGWVLGVERKGGGGTRVCDCKLGCGKANGNMQDQKKSLRLPFTFTGKDIRADKVMLKCSIPFRFNSFADAEVAYMRDGDEGFALGHNIVTFSVRDIDVNPIKQNFFKSQADLDLLYLKDTQVGNNLSLYKLKMPNKLAVIGRPINQFQQFFLKKFDYVIENYDDYTENTTWINNFLNLYLQ